MAIAPLSTISIISRWATQLTDRFARLCYWLHETRRARLTLWVIMLLGIASLVLARPGRIENALIRDARLSDISLASQGAWVRVSGRLVPEKGYQTRYELGSIELRGSRFIPLSSAESPDPLYVLDQHMPAYRNGDVVSLVGQVVLGEGEQPPIYLELGLPPNVVLANFIAQTGVVALVVSIVFSALAWLVHFASYALPAPLAGGAALALATTAASAPATKPATENHASSKIASKVAKQPKTLPQFLWYGDLGKEYGDVMVREVRCDFAATVHEARFICEEPKELWKVSIRHLRSAQLLDLATQYGSLPAARIAFEDERGLTRHAVFATDSPHTLNHALRVMSLIR